PTTSAADAAAAGGGGYGGYGGASIANAAGGNSYGSLLQPIDGGSAGGGNGSIFGFGGGAIRLIVSKTLVLEGRISSDGTDAPGEGGGGGSGGSVWLTVGKLSGHGAISAD